MVVIWQGNTRNWELGGCLTKPVLHTPTVPQNKLIIQSNKPERGKYTGKFPSRIVKRYRSNSLYFRTLDFTHNKFDWTINYKSTITIIMAFFFSDRFLLQELQSLMQLISTLPLFRLCKLGQITPLPPGNSYFFTFSNLENYVRTTWAN